MESLKYIWEFHTPFCYCDDISTPQNVTLNKTNYDRLFDMSVKRPHGQSEGLATWDDQPSRFFVVWYWGLWAIALNVSARMY